MECSKHCAPIVDDLVVGHTHTTRATTRKTRSGAVLPMPAIHKHEKWMLVHHACCRRRNLYQEVESSAKTMYSRVALASRGWRTCASGQKVAEAVAVVAVVTLHDAHLAARSIHEGVPLFHSGRCENASFTENGNG